MGVLMLAAGNTALMCGLCPPKTSSTPTHCADKDAHSAQPVEDPPDDSRLAVQNPVDPCSHCVAPSPWQTNPSLSEATPNSSSQSILGPELFVVVAEFSASHSFVEIHDHGPPGNANPRYLLNSTFRI